MASRVVWRSTLVILGGCASACSIIFSVDGYAGPKSDAGEAGSDALTVDATGLQERPGMEDVLVDTLAADGGDEAGDADGGAVCPSSPAPVVYWKLDEGEGGVVSDSTGNGAVGTLMGAPVWVTDISNQSPALAFNGMTTQYVDFGNPPALHLSSGMTISARVNLASFPDGGPDQPILSKRGLGDRGWQLYVSEGAFAFDVASSATAYKPVLYGASSLAFGTWYHVVAVYDQVALHLYVDGAPVGTLSVGVPPFQHDSVNPVHLGNAAGCSLDGGVECSERQLFDGILDDIRVYSVALSACQVQKIP